MSFRTKAYIFPYTLRFCPLFKHAELSVCTPAHIGKAAMAAMVATKPKVVQQILLQEHSLAFVQYCTPAHIGKALMAAMVTTKPEVVQQILLIRKRCAMKSHASLPLTVSRKNHYFESGKAAMAAMAGKSSKVTQKYFLRQTVDAK